MPRTLRTLSTTFLHPSGLASLSLMLPPFLWIQDVFCKILWEARVPFSLQTKNGLVPLPLSTCKFQSLRRPLGHAPGPLVIPILGLRGIQTINFRRSTFPEPPSLGVHDGALAFLDVQFMTSQMCIILRTRRGGQPGACDSCCGEVPSEPDPPVPVQAFQPQVSTQFVPEDRWCKVARGSIGFCCSSFPLPFSTWTSWDSRWPGWSSDVVEGLLFHRIQGCQMVWVCVDCFRGYVEGDLSLEES